MFFWNYYLRNRYRLIAYLAAGCGLTLVGTLPVTMRLVKGHWVWVRPKTISDAVAAWDLGVEHVVFALVFVLLLAAADFGSRGLGESAARKECDFLLTRPRSRRNLVWTGWLAGVTQLALVELLPLILATATLTALASGLHPGRLPVLSVGMFVLTALVFSGSYALTLATGSTRGGFELASSLVIIYAIARWTGSYFLLEGLFYMPSDVYAGGTFDWLLGKTVVHYWVLLVMTAATIPLPFLAQLGFERKDL